MGTASWPRRRKPRSEGRLGVSLPGLTAMGIAKDSGVLNLETLLDGIGPSGRLAFLDLLALEGFEITHGIPNLQLPEEINAAIDSLVALGHGGAWSKLNNRLVEAAVFGILVDMNVGHAANE